MNLAFPVITDADPNGSVIDTGMTLRDYFAAQAMMGLLSRAIALHDDELAERAYDIALEMEIAKHKMDECVSEVHKEADNEPTDDGRRT